MNTETDLNALPMASTWVRLERSGVVNESIGYEADHCRLDVSERKQGDPILNAIFSALGVDENYLERSENQAPNTWQQRSVHAGEEPKPWILHVDDDIEFSNAMKMRLEAYGVSVAQACNGLSGVKQTFAMPASAIILDYEMPQGDGKYVLERLKACEATKDIPVIILTGYRDRGLKQELLALGAASFLSKPIELDAMLATLNQYVCLHAPRGAACLLT